MQRLFMSLVLIVIFLMAALVAAPLFIDTESYKEEVKLTIKSATGLDAEINGEVNVSFFPTPTITVSNVSVPNIEGAASANLLNVSSIAVLSSFQSLMKGKVNIKKIELIDPTLELETLSDGSSSWKLLSNNFNERVLPEGFQFPERIAIKNGTISHRIKSKKKTIDYISSTIEADSFNGPFSIEGNFSNNENIINFVGNIGEFVEGEISSFKLSSDSLLINMVGEYKAGENPGIEGRVEGQTSNLANFFKLFFDSGSVFSKIKSKENMTLDGGFKLSSRVASFDNMTISSDSIDGVTSVEALISEKRDNLQWDIDIDIKRANFDKLLDEEKDESNEIDYYATTLKTTSISDYRFDIPKNLNALFKLKIKEIKHNDQKITDLLIDTDVFNGKATIHNFSANLPGKSQIKFIGNVEHNGTRPLLNGLIEASGESLRTVVWWLFNDLSFIPAGELGEYLFNCELKMTPQTMDILNITLSSDKSLLTGNILMSPSRTIPVIKADINLDRFDLDRYGFTKAINDRFIKFISNAADKNLESSWLKMHNTNMDLSLNAKNLNYNNNKISDIVASLTINRGLFALQKLILKSDKTNIDGSLYINIMNEQPAIDIDVKSSGFDTSFFLNPNVQKSDEGQWEWSEDAFNLLGIDRFSGKARFAFQSFKHKNLILDKAILDGILDKKVFNINRASAELFDGKVAIKGSVGVSEENPSFGISIVMSAVNAKELANVFSDEFKTDGKIYLSGTAKTFGGNPSKWIKSLTLESKFVGRNITVNNFDLNSIIDNSRKLYSVIDMDSVVKKAIRNGSTKFDSIEGNINTSKAIIALKDFQLITKKSRGVFAGNINMLNGDLAGVTKISYLPEKDKSVSLGVNLKGNIINIEKSIDTRLLDSYITSKGRR